MRCPWVLGCALTTLMLTVGCEPARRFDARPPAVAFGGGDAAC
jgi:hypothetical protein